jgi:twitching motility protein PilT
MQNIQINDLLQFMVKQEASDLHLKPMRPPLVRLNGRLLPLKSDPIPPELLNQMLMEMMPDRMVSQLEKTLAVDFGYSMRGISRFRASIFYQRGNLSAVFRRVPFQFPTLDDWGLPPIIKELSDLKQGLVLITGPTGSGKSSTLAALMRTISDEQLVHIVTIEDPIEFLFRDGKAAVTQREIGTDTPNFSEALRNSLRQDPDIIMVGEMRDRETIQTVLTAAETGHLVFSTLHTNGAVQTIDRIIDMFDESHHRQIRQQLSTVLQAVISLKLVERADGNGLIAAVEILRLTPRTSKLISEGNIEALQEEIAGSVTYHKMQTLNQSLAALTVHGATTRESALAASPNPGDLDLMLRKIAVGNRGVDHDNMEDDVMAEPLSDFSAILELQEIKRLYDELQDRHRSELSDRDGRLEELSAELDELRDRTGSLTQTSSSDPLKDENDRLTHQMELIREEYEGKIERLNSRIRDLSSGSPGTASEQERRGFFRR